PRAMAASTQCGTAARRAAALSFASAMPRSVGGGRETFVTSSSSSSTSFGTSVLAWRRVRAGPRERAKSLGPMITRPPSVARIHSVGIEHLLPGLREGLEPLPGPLQGTEAPLVTHENVEFPDELDRPDRVTEHGLAELRHSLLELTNRSAEVGQRFLAAHFPTPCTSRRMGDSGGAPSESRRASRPLFHAWMTCRRRPLVSASAF